MTFEWLNKSNVLEMESINRELFKQDVKMVRNEEGSIYRDVLLGKYHNCSKMNYALIKEDNGRTVGIIGYYQPNQDPNSIWIGWFGIKEVFRRQGYGKKALKGLINYVKKSFPEITTLRVYTGIHENPIALHLYESLGFERENKLFKLKEDSDETVVLSMSLDGNPVKYWNEVPIW